MHYQQVTQAAYGLLSEAGENSEGGQKIQRTHWN